ncbi:MAG: sulfur oxidation c-type cytochrome SoxX, partial [Chromatiales bacterium]|nr:sulfur oxidation c-type cytochrome SoxX [Chromatiales bacterium]
ATDRTGGNIGPSLTGYGKSRGNSEAVRRFVFEMIYNPHTYFPCTDMPRMGAKGLLTHEQIADLMAYILDPESPVNK